MKNNKIILGALMVLAFSSCEKVINVDLKNAEQKIVIEGIVDNTGKPATVKITKTVNFSSGNNFPTLSGATVKITDNTGAVFNLTETNPGSYTNASLIGVKGNTYTLSVLAEGKTYIGTSKIPRGAPLDTLEQETLPIGNAQEKVVSVIYTDPVGFGDYCQVIQTPAGKKDKGVHIADDSFTDGGNSPFLIYAEDAKLKTGDNVKIELRFIDKNVYRYLKGIEDLQEGNTIPANPDSNISGGCLGFFSAHTSESKTIIIQ
jgi:biopolymer transport protein ExbD